LKKPFEFVNFSRSYAKKHFRLFYFRGAMNAELIVSFFVRLKDSSSKHNYSEWWWLWLKAHWSSNSAIKA